MSSNILKAMQNLRKNLHNVGSLNNWCKTVLNQGAKVDTVAAQPIDNFTLVELDFNDAGERVCKKLTNNNKKGFLVATPEDYVQEYETISSFFNGVGEMARIVTMEVGMRFECSNFSLDQRDESTHPIKNGQKVHYNQADHTFLISNNSNNAPNGGYAQAANQLVVVDKDCVSIDGQRVIRFEVTK